MKFSFSAEKLNKDKIRRAMGHNLRAHPTASQLPEQARFTPTSNIGDLSVRWNDAAISKAQALSKRKDAVIAIEFVLQVGKQTDWREPPTKEHPEGEPYELTDSFVERFFVQAKQWVSDEFGLENLVSMQLHLDESTPHMHIVVTPVTKENKLQAKQWLDGGSRLGSIRKRCHEAINQRIKCEYTPNSGIGGSAHDVSKRAGASPAPTLVDKVTGKKKINELTDENDLLKKRIARLEDLVRYREKAYFNKLKIEEANIAIQQNTILNNDVDFLTSELEKVKLEFESKFSDVENDFKKKEMALMSKSNRELSTAQSDYDVKERDLSLKVVSLENELEKANSEIVVLTKKNNHLADQNNELDEQLRERHGLGHH